jgi:hypothetical protein
MLDETAAMVNNQGPPSLWPTDRFPSTPYVSGDSNGGAGGSRVPVRDRNSGAGLDSSIRYSWADPSLGLTHLVVRASTADVQKRIDASPETDYTLGMYHYAWEHHRMILVHEWIHILQVATYPWLFLRAARALRRLPAPFALLRSQPGKWDLPLRFAPIPEYADSRELETVAVRITVEGEGLRYRPVLSTRLRGVLTEQDLVEEDATVAEYRIEIGGSGNGASYRHWLTERPHYQRTFSLLSQHMSDDAALLVLPILVRVAFQTTRPIESFARGLARVLLDGPEVWTDPVHVNNLEKVLLDEALTRLGVADDRSTSFLSHAISDQPGFITADQFGVLLTETAHLPVSLLGRWSRDDDASQDGTPYLVGVLREPWRDFGRRAGQISETLGRYMPPGTTIELDDPAFPIGQTVLIVSPALVDECLPGQNELTYRHVIIEGLRTRMVTDALTGEREPHHRCPHQTCPVHQTGLCRGWIPIPRTFADCQFPGFFQAASGHWLDDTGRALVPVEEATRQ